MLLAIADLLTAEEVADLRRLIEDADLQDGRVTAGWNAAPVKANRQVPFGGPDHARGDAIVRAALLRNDLVRMAARPLTVRAPLLALYGPGESYGLHVDDPIMEVDPGRPGRPMRTDVSCTIWLTDPDDYEGGELIMDGTDGTQTLRLPAGSAVLYGTGVRHRVAPVTGGRRMVAVTWMQSQIRDPQQRQILFDLDRARRRVFESEGKSKTFDDIATSLANLQRLWADI